MTDNEKLAQIRILLEKWDGLVREKDASQPVLFYNLGIFAIEVERLTRPEPTDA